MPSYKFGKNTTPITFDYFNRCMSQADFPNFSRMRNLSFLAILYYTGARVTQLVELRKEEFHIDDGFLHVQFAAKKRGLDASAKIALTLPYMKFVQSQLSRTRTGARVWNFTRQAAWILVKSVFGERCYPHFFRLNRVTRFLDDPTTTIPDMKAWFGWKSSKTIDAYVGYSKRHVDRQAERLQANP